MHQLELMRERIRQATLGEEVKTIKQMLAGMKVSDGFQWTDCGVHAIGLDSPPSVFGRKRGAVDCLGPYQLQDTARKSLSVLAAVNDNGPIEQDVGNAQRILV